MIRWVNLYFLYKFRYQFCIFWQGRRGGIFQLNGNISVIALPSEKADDLLIMLNNEEYTGNLNVRKNRHCR